MLRNAHRYLAAVLLLHGAVSAGLVRVTAAGQIQPATNGLAAGDTLVVAAGTYDLATWNIAGISGAPGTPVVIMAEGDVVVRGTSGSANLVQLSNVHYLEFRGFELTMRDAYDGIDGINLRGAYNSYITFEDLYIHHMTNVGIGMWPDSTAFVTLRNSEIAYNTGSGLYWGYPGRNIVHDVLIERNYIHHCPASDAEPTHYGIQWKGWCYRAVIRDNVLHDVGGTTRSGLIVYYGRTPLAGDVPGDANIVQGNVLWNCRNEGITAMSDAVIENNIVFDAGVGINLQTYNDESFTGSNAVENLVVRNNTVFRCRSSCVSIGGWGSAGGGCAFVANAAYQGQVSARAIAGSIGTGVSAANVYYGTSAVTQGAVAGSGLGDFMAVTAAGTVPVLDFYPSSGSALLERSSDATRCAGMDFNGTARPQAALFDAGAYERSAGTNPGWRIAEGFKGSPSPVLSEPSPGRSSQWPLSGTRAAASVGRHPVSVRVTGDAAAHALDGRRVERHERPVPGR